MAATAATSASLCSSSKQIVSTSCTTSATSFWGSSLPRNYPIKRRLNKIRGQATAAAAAPVADAPVTEIKNYVLPRWADFDLGRAPVYWKTMNGLPPTDGERLKLFYNPKANKLVPNEDYGIAFNGGFNQPIMCGGEPRVILLSTQSKYASQSMGLAKELSKEGSCDRAMFPDTNIVVTRCAMIGNLTVEGGGRCSLDLVPGCTDPSSPLFNPMANVDDGSCPPYLDSVD